MNLEGQRLDQKSLRALTGKAADWNEIAKTTSGRLLLGTEDRQSVLPADQRAPPALSDTLWCKLAKRTVNATVLPDISNDPNGDQYVESRIPRAMAVACTADGRDFLRVADQSKSVVGDDMMRIASDRSALLWETQGNGFDKNFEVLLSLGRPAPVVIETHDRGQFMVRRGMIKPEIIGFPAKAVQIHQLKQCSGNVIHPRQVKRAQEELIERRKARFEENDRCWCYWTAA